MKRLYFVTILICNTIFLFGQTSPCDCGDPADCPGASFTDEATAVVAIDNEDPTMIAASPNCTDLTAENIPMDDGLTYKFCYTYVHTGGFLAVESQLAVPDVATCIPSSTLTKEVFLSGNCAAAITSTGNTTDDGWEIYELAAGIYNICTTADLDETACCGNIEGICTYVHPVCPEILTSGLAVTAGTNPDCALSNNLFISEYVEGTSNNHCIEIYNGTGADIDLGAGGYSVDIYNNGAATPNTSTALSGVLTAGGVYVTCTVGADPSFLAIAGGNFLTGGNFNGDDAIVLMQNTDTLDVFGLVGCDPGAAWSNGSNTTAGFTLVRNPTVLDGITTNPSVACDFSSLASEWISFPEDTDTELGSHVTDCNVCIDETFDMIVYSGVNLPASGTIDWYYSTTSGFDPFAGAGTIFPNSATITGAFPLTASASFTDVGLCDMNVYVKGIVNPISPTSCESLAQTPEYTLFVPCPDPTIAETDVSGSANDDSSICAGDNAVVTVNETFVGYLWSEGSAITQGITVTPATTTTYTVTVTNSSGCTATEEIIITVNPLPVPVPIIGETSGTTDNDGIICTGDNATLRAGTFASYLWSDASSASTLIVSAAGTYTVIVTDINGCTASSEFVIISNPIPVPASTITETSGTTADDGIICSGDDAILDVGVAIGTYLWSDATTNQTLTVSAGGTYTVTLTDANGCEATSEFVITENAIPVPVPTITETSGTTDDDGIICTGDDAILDVGVAIGTYLWSDATTNQTLTVSAGGTYTVTLTDANSCEATSEFVITENAIPIPVPTITETSGTTDDDGIICTGDDAILDVGVVTGTYLWSDATT
ncbi:MAG: hypothetical protein ACI94Y_000907, partial [Maribacter sp.]